MNHLWNESKEPETPTLLIQFTVKQFRARTPHDDVLKSDSSEYNK